MTHSQSPIIAFIRNRGDTLGLIEECSICGDVADGFHYGVLSCRGCNAFFRRAVTYGMQFYCRRGGTCQVNKNARCACRACRLKKCEQMGMDRRAVQTKRIYERKNVLPENIESVRGQTDDLKKFSNPLSNCKWSNISSAAKKKTSSLISCNNTLPSTSQSGLIAQLANDYREQRERRRLMFCRCVEEILLDDLEITLKRPASGHDYADIFKIQVVLMYEWVLKLEEFNAIENSIDKSNLLRRFALRYMLLDNVFHTVELGVRDRIILVNNTYITPGNIPDIVLHENDCNSNVKKIIYGERSIHLIDDLITPMIDMNFTVGELMALRLITFWNSDNLSLSPETRSIVQMASNRAVNELYSWYKDEKFEAANTRLGNILLLLSSITKQVNIMAEMVKLIPSFGTLSERDTFLQHILFS